MTKSPTTGSTPTSCTWRCFAPLNGRSQPEARRALLTPLQRAVSCITDAVTVRGPAGASATDSFVFEQRYVSRRGRYRLELSLLHTFNIQERLQRPDRWTATSDGCFYQLRERNGKKIIAFHWHPGQRGQPDFPHLHMRSRVSSVVIDRKNHIPTGRISLEAVVRFVIVELGVEPRRDDWARVLDEGEQRFTAASGW